MSWLTDLVNQHQEFESPLSFWKWGALAAISAVIKDQVWLPRHIYNLYPNIYVMFHAESGLKKGPPVSMAKQLVEPVNNTKIISGRSSIQGILKDMGTAHTMPGGKIVTNSTAFICSSELTSSIIDDPVATKILTDLYDRNYNVGNWRSLLKMESFDLKNPTVTMLTATNEAMSESFFTKSAMQGGYFARTFIIYENKRNRPNSLVVPPKFIPDYKTSSAYLKQLAQLKGPIQLLGAREQSDTWSLPHKDRTTKETYYFSEAGLLYEEWYDEFIETSDEFQIKDETGTLNRFGDSVLKIAILLSLARRPELIIDTESMREAILLCEKLIGNIRQTTMGKSGMSLASPMKALIIKELLQRDNHQVSRAMLMKKMWMHYSDPEEFDNIMLSFDDAGMIKIESIGNQVIYRMIDTQVKELKDFFEGKSK